MTRNEKIGQKRIKLRNDIFPQVREDDLWLRKKSTGFMTIPRALPLLMALMDRLSKGKPVSATYLELWCRMYDECFAILKPREMAYHSGFSGQRAEQTWSERMKILQKLGFIDIAPGAEGAFGYAVVRNPYKVLESYFKDGHPGLDAAAYNALRQRVGEIGAKDLDDPAASEAVVIVEEQTKPGARKPGDKTGLRELAVWERRP